MKVCKKCGQCKPQTEFSKDKERPDGLRFYCRKCNTSYVKSKYVSHTKRATPKRDFSEVLLPIEVAKTRYEQVMQRILMGENDISLWNEKRQLRAMLNH